MASPSSKSSLNSVAADALGTPSSTSAPNIAVAMAAASTASIELVLSAFLLGTVEPPGSGGDRPSPHLSVGRCTDLSAVIVVSREPA